MRAVPPRLDFDPDAPGSVDAGLFGIDCPVADASVVVIPVPWEVTTSYGRGTAGGPAAVLEASPQLDLHDPSLARLGLGDPWRWGLAMLDVSPRIARLDAEVGPIALDVIRAAERGEPVAPDDPRLTAVAQASAERTAWVEQQAEAIFAAGQLPGVLGGDHSVPLGAIVAAARRHPGLAILHIDAHADLRVAYEGFVESHASIMDRVLALAPQLSGLVGVAIRDVSRAERERAAADPRITTFYDFELADRAFSGEPWAKTCDTIVSRLEGPVWISFDIDGLDPSLCPGTGTPVPGGLSLAQAFVLLETVARVGKTVVGFDLCEVAPRPRDDWDGNVGARVLYKLCGVALASHGRRDLR